MRVKIHMKFHGMWFRAADKKHGKVIPATPTCIFIQTFTILHDSEIRCRTWVQCFISILVKRIKFIVHAWIHLEKSYFLETLHQIQVVGNAGCWKRSRRAEKDYEPSKSLFCPSHCLALGLICNNLIPWTD